MSGTDQRRRSSKVRQRDTKQPIKPEGNESAKNSSSKSRSTSSAAEALTVSGSNWTKEQLKELTIINKTDNELLNFLDERDCPVKKESKRRYLSY
jgi:hypothetical protein